VSAFDHDAGKLGDAAPAAQAERLSAVPADAVQAATSQPLDAASRVAMQAPFGHDFTDVRIHADQGAASAARAIGARAFAKGRDIVFGSGEYAPHTARGKELLAHELAHIVQQQRQQGPSDRAEARADLAAARAVRGQAVDPQQLGAAALGVQRQPVEPDLEEPLPKLEFTPFSVPYRFFAPAFPSLYPPLGGAEEPGLVPPLSLGESGGAAHPLPPLSESRITPPRGQEFKPPRLPERGLGTTPTVPSLEQPTGITPTSQQGPLAPTADDWSPPGPIPAGESESASADLPSRVGVADVGQFSLGLRFGLPTPAQAMPGTPPERRPQTLSVPGAGASVRSYSDFQFELLDMHMSGQPQGFAAIDMGELAKVSFSILSTHIAPDLFKQLSESMAGKEGPPFHLDLTVTGDFQGGGITFSMPFDEAPKRYRGPQP